jgi:hypothetical protein
MRVILTCISLVLTFISCKKDKVQPVLNINYEQNCSNISHSNILGEFILKERKEFKYIIDTSVNDTLLLNTTTEVYSSNFF